jgi:RNA polymerase sigma factor (sigma-70 family)
MTDSQTLLSLYAQTGSESAFRELVSRYIDLVYSTACRLVGGDVQSAQDVAQTVFVALADKAGTLPKDVMLGGWLHQHTRFAAGKLMRTERRRQLRERQAAEMNAIEDHSESNLARVAPVLDEAIGQLDAEDRTAILLRFFERKDFRGVGDALGSSEDAARKRVDRALEKLHVLLKHRAATLSAAALGTALATEAVTAAPAGLAGSVAGGALASAAAGGGIAATLVKLMTMTKVKFGILSVIAAGGAAVLLCISLGRASLTEAPPGGKSSEQLKQQMSPPTEPGTATAEAAPRATADLRQEILGAWELVAVKTAPATEFTDYPKDHRQVKLFTPYRFLWAEYDTTTSNTVAEAGGPYAISGDVCTETIEFANEAMADQQGSQSKLDIRIEGNRQYQSGGVGDTQAEEIWQRIAAPPNAAESKVRKELAGAWEMVAYKEWNTTNYISTPSDRRRVRFFTMTYYAWVDYDLASKRVAMGIGGPYAVPDESYIETIQFAEGFMTGYLGAHAKFKLRVEGDIYYQLALSKINYDEIWQRVKPPAEHQ